MQKLLHVKLVEDVKDVCFLRKMFEAIEIKIKGLEKS